MTIYTQLFYPTFLYIKQHSVTGKLYFGKTTQKDPIKYRGSGLHWKYHIKKYGKEHIITLWHELFENEEELTEFALDFSKKMNIVSSKSWLNLIEESGLGVKHSEETKKKISTARKGKKHSDQPPAMNRL